VGVQTSACSKSFHLADNKTIKRLVQSLLQSGQLVQAPDVTIPIARSKLGVRHDRVIVVYTPNNKARSHLSAYACIPGFAVNTPQQ
jgi:hypothetical protein